MIRKVTRSGEVSLRALQAGVVTLPEGVSYLRIPGIGEAGDFPHRAIDPTSAVCDAALLIRVVGGIGGGHDWDPWCTRDHGHPDLHVANLAPGAPIAAWTDAS
jgi:hypothetical protein